LKDIGLRANSYRMLTRRKTTTSHFTLEMKTPTNTAARTNDETYRCVVLFHEVENSDHWDLMLEVQNRLWTWRMSELPTINQTVMGERITDHRIHYLDYEGPVSNNRGTVRRVRTGRYQWVQPGENRLAVLYFNEERWNVCLEHESPIAKISRAS